MENRAIRATVLMAKCRHSGKPFGIRIEERNTGAWYCTWAFPLSESAGSREGYDETRINGQVALDPEYPGCPHCEAQSWFTCGSCNKITCHDGSVEVICGWCGISGTCCAAENFDLTGGGY